MQEKKFKSRLFPIINLNKIPTRQPNPEQAAETEVATEPTPESSTETRLTKHKKFKLKFQQEFVNEIIPDEKDINCEIFWDYFKYQNPLFLVKDSIKIKLDKNEKLVNYINDGLINLQNARKDILDNRKEIPESENPKNVVNVIEKILNFRKQQKVKDFLWT